MIFQSLYKLYDRLADEPKYQIPKLGYSRQKTTFKVVLTPEGQLFDILPEGLPVEGRTLPRQLLVLGEKKPSGQGINPRFLWDNTTYMLGYDESNKKPERTLACFEAFRDYHLGFEKEIDTPAFSRVCRFLESWDPAKAEEILAPLQLASGFGVFQTQGETSFVHQDPTIDRWWRSQLDRDVAEPGGQCLVTAEEKPLARLHPGIRGVAGAKSDATIAGFNENAFESYGKRQSYNAPVSETAAFRYIAALNALLDGPMRDKHRIVVADTTIAFWTDRPSVVEDLFSRYARQGSELLTEEEAQDEGARLKVEAFLRALRTGQEAYGELGEDPRATTFYLLGLSPNSARVSVRFFHRGTLGELLDNLRCHHQDIGLVPQPASGKRSADPELPPLWMLLRQTVRDRKDNPPPILAGALLQAVMTKANYPRALYTAVLRRIQADRTINYLRACVLKGYLVRNRNMEVSMSLDKERNDPAYRLGRLFAALEMTQREAHDNKLKRTIRETFYGAASATPRSVFPRLLRTYQHHLAKLIDGHKINREKLVQEIMDPLTDFPGHLDLANQGLFAIGYYHQTRDFFTKHDKTEAAS